jgi:hypothetical protein
LQKNGASVCYYLIAFVLKARRNCRWMRGEGKKRGEGIGADFFINETLEDNNRRSYHHSFFSLKSRRRRCRRLTFHAFDSILYCALSQSQCAALGLRAGVVFIVRPRAHAIKNTF